MDYFINAAPQVVNYGAQDLSKMQVPRVAVQVPQHLPHVFFYGKKGDTNRHLMASTEADNFYHADSFDETGKYFNHSSIFITQMRKVQQLMYQRIVPEDANPPANMQLWLDVLPTTVNVYQRNSDGSIKTDATGAPIANGTAQGYKVKWVVTNTSDAAGAATYGQLKQKAGTQVDTTSNTQSTLYPIAEFQVSYQGEDGDNVGIRLWAPTIDDSTALPEAMMAKEMAYPFVLSVIRRDDAFSSPTPVSTLFGEKSFMFTFKEKVRDPNTKAQYYLPDIFFKKYQNLSDPVYPQVVADFGNMCFYQSNIDTLVNLFYTAEVPFINAFSDITADPKSAYLFNFVSGVSSQNVPYTSFQLVNDSTSVSLTKNTNLYAAGGSDGTMSDEKFAASVEAIMAKYADPADEVQDDAGNPVSAIYDTGFPLSTKKALCKFISLRRDTFVVLSTFIAGEAPLEADQEYSTAVTLRSYLQTYPESDYFGTPCARGMIIGFSGLLRDSNWTARVPVSLELAIKASKYMGASNGVWQSGESFDRYPGNTIDYLTDISAKYMSPTVRNKNWDAGLNWVSKFDMMTLQFPALKTIYDDDTSVLNSFCTVMALCTLNKVVNKTFRKFQGEDDLDDAQLIDAVNNDIKNQVKGIFDNRYIIEPQAFFTNADSARGYSWTVPVKLYANPSRTVMTTYIQTYRMDQYSATATA